MHSLQSGAPGATVLDDLVTHHRVWSDALAREADRTIRGPSVWKAASDALDLAVAQYAAQKGLLAADGLRTAIAAFPAIRLAMTARLDEAVDGHDGSMDSDDGSYWTHELKVLDRLEGHIRELAGPPRAMEGRLHDWRAGEGEPDAADTVPPVAFTISTTSSMITVETTDGRIVAIEMEDGVLKARAYNETFDEPVSIVLPAAGILSVDDGDYRLGRANDPAPEI